ncbi:hypothetical protein CDAR_32591 [Caerostris darwini]|uniref:Uncharacterized protein n=1 Tax=Caerostris darwini TaxID=1538125 RepID=A0AAV4P8N1_9ARAC|nr:hypothetical protein CDAR_32591 [Caerostris darwini]
MTNTTLLSTTISHKKALLKSAQIACTNPLSSPHTPIENPPPAIFFANFYASLLRPLWLFIVPPYYASLLLLLSSFYKVCKIDTIPDPMASTTTSLSNTACRVPQPSTRTISDIMGTHGLLSSMLNSFFPLLQQCLFLTRCVDFRLWNCRSGSRAIQEPHTQQDLLED